MTRLGGTAGHATCVDLFAGAGGFSLAAGKLGMAVKLAIENDRHAAETYRRNFDTSQKGTKLIEKDIREVDPQSLRLSHFQEESCDVILGGPPCQGFSAHRINDAGVDDERNALIHVYFDFVRELRPTAFLLENVPGMLWPRHESYLRRFKREAEEAGYQLQSPCLLDARDFGVPQRRRRVFILGVRRDLNADLSWPPRPTHGSPSALEADQTLLPWRSCEAVFKRAPPGDPNNVHMGHSDALVEVFKATPLRGGSRHESGRVLPCHKEHDGHNDVYGRIDPKQPGPTVTTACINPSKGRFVHPTQHHGITARQAARLQTFPDEFVFEGGLMAAGRQIGNAVPVDLAKVLLRHLMPLVASAREMAAQDPVRALVDA